MKKIILPIILAAALGVGGGIAAVMLNRTNNAAADAAPEDKVPENLEVKSGKYYLNGDKNSGLWIEVTPEYLVTKADSSDIDSVLTSLLREIHRDAVDLNDFKTAESDFIDIDYVGEDELKSVKDLLFNEKEYALESFIPEQSRYLIAISCSSERELPESFVVNVNGSHLIYSRNENLIRSKLGDFILIDG